MDTSYWTKLNPKVTVEHAKKKFFNKFLFKLTVNCPLGREIDSKLPIVEAVEARKERDIRFRQMWPTSYRRPLNFSGVYTPLLEIMRAIKQKKIAGIKFRIEEPSIHIYAETDKQLKDIVKKHFTQDCYEFITGFAGPEDSSAESVLNTNAIIKSKSNGYKYKVILKDGTYDAFIKTSLLNYIEGVGTENAKLSRSSIRSLSSASRFIHGVYFYSNDLSLNSFVELINPGIILNSHELVVL
jgi:hypothetical protein